MSRWRPRSVTSGRSLRITKLRVTNTALVAVIALVLALAAFFLMAFRLIPELAFWIVIVPCAVVAYWLVPRMKEKETGKAGKR